MVRGVCFAVSSTLSTSLRVFRPALQQQQTDLVRVPFYQPHAITYIIFDVCMYSRFQTRDKKRKIALLFPSNPLLGTHHLHPSWGVFSAPHCGIAYRMLPLQPALLCGTSRRILHYLTNHSSSILFLNTFSSILLPPSFLPSITYHFIHPPPEHTQL